MPIHDMPAGNASKLQAYLISHVVLCGMSIANEPAGSPAGVALVMHLNGSRPVMPAYFPVPPSMYCLPPASMLTAVHFAFMLSSILSPFIFSVGPTASSEVALPAPGTSMLDKG